MSSSQEVSSSSGAKRGAPLSNGGFIAPPAKKRKNTSDPMGPMPDLPDPMHMLDNDDGDQKMTDDVAVEQSGEDSQRSRSRRRRETVPATPAVARGGQRRRHSAAPPRTARKKVRDSDLRKEMEVIDGRIKIISNRKKFEIDELKSKLHLALQNVKFEKTRFETARKRYEEECDLIMKRAGGTTETKELQTKFGALQEKFNKQMSALQDARSYREVTEKANDDLRKQNAAFRDEVARVKLTQHQLELKLSHGKRANTLLKGAMQELNDSGDKLKAEAADARTKAQLVEEQLKLFQAMHHAVQRELTTLKEHEQRRLQEEANASLDKHAGVMAQEIREIREQCNKQVEQANAQAQEKVQSQLTKLEKQVKETHSELVAAKAQAASARTRIEQAQQEQARAERQMTLLKKQKDVLEDEVSKYVDREREFMSELIAKNTEINELRTEVATVAKERNAVEARGGIFDAEEESKSLISNLQRLLDVAEARDVKYATMLGTFLAGEQAGAARDREAAEREAAKARAQYKQFVVKGESQDDAKMSSRAPLRQHAQVQPAAPPMSNPEGTPKSEKPKVDRAQTRGTAKKLRQESSARVNASVEAA